MPELPEVETVVRGLRKRVLNRKILRVKVKTFRIVRPEKPLKIQRQLKGKTILTIDRIGKWIGFRLSPSGCLWAHLGMTGRFLWNDRDKYNRAEFHLDGANILYYSDMRMFGKLIFDGVGGESPPRVTLGPDPIIDSIDIERLCEILHKRSVAIKDVLLDQRVVAGIGNIYASEILFDAKLHPLRAANSLNIKECEVLAQCIISCLESAIEYGGTTISDFLTLEGSPGGFEKHLKVYGKQGLPCPICSTPLERYVLHSRSGIFCPSCQS